MSQLTVSVLFGLALVMVSPVAARAQPTGAMAGAGIMPLNGPHVTKLGRHSYAAESGRYARARSIHVSATAQVSATPNDMIALFDVTTISPSVDEGTLAQTRATERLVEAIKKACGNRAKITAGSFTLTPYAMPAPAAVAKPVPPRKQWVFFATVTAYTDTMPAIGKIIDAAMAAGATSVESTGFRIGELGSSPPVFNPNYRGGRGAPKRKPYVSMAVRTSAQSAGECTRRGSEITGRVKRAMEHALGGKDTVRVETFQVNQRTWRPQFEYRQRSKPHQGFRAHNTVRVQTRDLSLLGAIMTAGEGVHDRLEVVEFTLSSDSPGVKEAIDRATRDAKAKAEIVAKAMGVKLGKPINIFINTSVQPQIVYGGGRGAFALTGTPGSRIALRSGQATAQARVTLSYAIN